MSDKRVSKIQDSIDEVKNIGSQPTIVLYADIRPRFLTYYPLYLEFRSKGFRPILLLSKEISLTEVHVGFVINESDLIFNADGQMVSALVGVDLFFSSEALLSKPPIGCTSVAIHHSLPDHLGLKTNYKGLLKSRPTIVSRFDYLVLSVKQSQSNWMSVNFENGSDKVYPQELLEDRTKSLYFVPGGYPKVDFVKECSNLSNEKYIIYAPTSHRQKSSEVLIHGEAIISALLAKFSDKTVVFRPYPNSFNQYDFIEKFKGNPRFIVDESLTGLEFQRNAAFIVTDYSSAAVTFAVSNLKPALFVNFSNYRNDDSENIKDEAIGWRVYNSEQLRSVLDIIESGELKKESIFEFGENSLYNFGSSSSYLVSLTQCFISKESRDEFLALPRGPKVISDSCSDVFSKEQALEEQNPHIRRYKMDLFEWRESFSSKS